jgi:hypothetical protein
MLGLLQAMRQAEQNDADRQTVRWVLRMPLDSPLSHPERCWFWGKSPLSS